MQIFKAFVILIVGVFPLVIAATANAAECQFKFQNCGQRATTPTTRVITNTVRQRLGDLYWPGPGRRVQIRNNSQQIQGYILPDGTVTDPARRRVGTIGDLID